MKLQYEMQESKEVVMVRAVGRMVRSGELDAFCEIVTQFEGARIVVLDLSEVEMMDGGGLGALVYLRRWATEHGVQLKLASPSHFVYELLERTGLASRFDISSLEEAVTVLLMAGERPPRGYALAS